MRSISIKVVQGVAAIGAVMLLTGANGGGCGGGSGGGSGGGGPVEPPPEPCPDGTHLDVVCYDSGCNDPPQCYEECVPDGECGPDTEPVVVCGGGGMVPPDPGCDDGANCAQPLTYPEPNPDAPPPDDCWVECHPIDNCGPGFYEEWVCEDGNGSGGMGPDQPVCNGMDCPPPEPLCYPICVPIDSCGPGYHEEWVCWGSGGGSGGSSGGGQDDSSEPVPPPPDGDYCDFICVPDSMCPPDFYPATVCDQDGTCWEDCLPYDQPLPG